jgi:hypothetical protein
MSTRIKYFYFFSLFTGIIAASISCKTRTPPTEEELNVKTPVTIAPVVFKPVASFFDLPAITTYMNKSIIRATTTGNIEDILISQGDFVSVNQLLFTIRTRESMALGNSSSKDSTLSFKGLINISSHNQGVISSLSYRKGDFIQEGDELAVISEQSSLVFILDVPFELEKFVANQKNCKITLPDGREINGTISGKLPEMDMQSQTVRYVVKSSSSERLPANLIGNLKLVRSSNDKAMVLPKQAVLGDETQEVFWVMKLINDSTAIKVIVSKGFENNEDVEITKPIFLITDRVILTGNYGLPDTASISIVKE